MPSSLCRNTVRRNQLLWRSFFVRRPRTADWGQNRGHVAFVLGARRGPSREGRGDDRCKPGRKQVESSSVFFTEMTPVSCVRRAQGGERNVRSKCERASSSSLSTSSRRFDCRDAFTDDFERSFFGRTTYHNKCRQTNAFPIQRSIYSVSKFESRHFQRTDGRLISNQKVLYQVPIVLGFTRLANCRLLRDLHHPLS